MTLTTRRAFGALSQRAISVAAFALCALSLSSQASAANAVGECVYPKTLTKNGALAFKAPILLYSRPDASAPNPKTLNEFATYKIKEKKAGFALLATIPDYSQPTPEKNAGKLIGWARLSEFDAQAERDCF